MELNWRGGSGQQTSLLGQLVRHDCLQLWTTFKAECLVKAAKWNFVVRMQALRWWQAPCRMRLRPCWFSSFWQVSQKHTSALFPSQSFIVFNHSAYYWQFAYTLCPAIMQALQAWLWDSQVECSKCLQCSTDKYDVSELMDVYLSRPRSSLMHHLGILLTLNYRTVTTQN